MLPIAAAIFMNAPHAKQNLINSFWFVCLILVVYSFTTLFNPGLQISDKNMPGVVVRNHATQGLFFAVAAIIALSNTLKTSAPVWFRTLSCLTIPLFILNIAHVAIGRSGYIALIVLTISFIFLYFTRASLPKKLLLCILGTAVLVGILASTPTSLQRMELVKHEFTSEIDQTKQTSIGYRLTFWKNTIEMLPKYALLGTGTGGFEKAYAAQVEGKSGTAGVVTGDPHNQYLKILIEHGVIGLAVFLSILILLLWQPARNPFKAIGVASLFAIATTSLFNAHFSTFNEGQFIWIFAGSLLASEALSMHRKT